MRMADLAILLTDAVATLQLDYGMSETAAMLAVDEFLTAWSHSDDLFKYRSVDNELSVLEIVMILFVRRMNYSLAVKYISDDIIISDTHFPKKFHERVKHLRCMKKRYDVPLDVQRRTRQFI